MPMINYSIFSKEVITVRKPEKPGLKLAGLSVFLLLLLTWYFWDLPCVLRAITGIPCPTCGLTRAWLCAFRLDLMGAFLQYPMFWSIPVLVLYLLFDGKLFKNPRWNTWVLGICVAGIFLTWLARIFGFLGALSPL